MTKRITRHLPSTAKPFLLCLFLRRERGHQPRRRPGPSIMDAARAECRPSLSWQTGSSHRSTVMPVDDSFDSWVGHTLNCWPLEEHHCAEVFAVNASFKTDDFLLWSGLLSPRADALRENRGLCLNCHEDINSFKHCRHPFITASGCLNPELGQLGDDDAQRCWQARMVCYRRDDKSYHPNNKKNRCHLPGQSRRYHQDQG